MFHAKLRFPAAESRGSAGMCGEGYGWRDTKHSRQTGRSLELDAPLPKRQLITLVPLWSLTAETLQLHLELLLKGSRCYFWQCYLYSFPGKGNTVENKMLTRKIGNEHG